MLAAKAPKKAASHFESLCRRRTRAKIDELIATAPNA